MALWSQGECVAVDVAGERVEGRVWAYDGPNGVVVLRALNHLLSEMAALLHPSPTCFILLTITHIAPSPTCAQYPLVFRGALQAAAA